MTFPTQLECPTREITAGEPLHCKLKIYNPSEAVNEFTVEGLGEAARWVSADPPRLGLMPKTDGEVALALLVPTDSRVLAGQHTIRLRVHSALDEYDAKVEDLVVRIGRVTSWNLEVEPPTRRSKRSATYELRLVNDSNHPLSVELSATPSAKTLDARLSHTVVEASAFGVATATLKVAAPRHTGRSDLHHRIDIQPWVGDTQARLRKVAFVQQPRLSRWWLLLIVIAALVALVLAATEGLAWWNGQVLLERDHEGARVTQWQGWLNSSGHGLVVDGEFGRRTEAATRAFQEEVGLPSTGKVERRTWRAMRRHMRGNPAGAPADPLPWPAMWDRPRTAGSPGTADRTARNRSAQGPATAPPCRSVGADAQRRGHRIAARHRGGTAARAFPRSADIVKTHIAQARSARETLLRTLGDDPRIDGVRIALFDGDGYHLKVRVLRNADATGIPREVGGVAVRVVAA